MFAFLNWFEDEVIGRTTEREIEDSDRRKIIKSECQLSPQFGDCLRNQGWEKTIDSKGNND